MGWASGSELAEDIWNLVKDHLHLEQQRRVARQLIKLFENFDCDTIDECQQLCLDAGRVYNYETEEIEYWNKPATCQQHCLLELATQKAPNKYSCKTCQYNFELPAEL